MPVSKADMRDSGGVATRLPPTKSAGAVAPEPDGWMAAGQTTVQFEAQLTSQQLMSS